MRRTRFFTCLAFAALAMGCASSRTPVSDNVIETVFDAVFDTASNSLFGSPTERVDDDELRMLERKGIKPGSEEHRRLKFEEETWEDFRR